MTPKKPPKRAATRLKQFLPYLFFVLGDRMSLTTADLRVGRHRLTVQEWKVISIIADCGPVSSAEIRRLGTQDKSTISWAIKRLKDRGFIAVEAHPGDRRTFNAVMTEAGWDFYSALAPVAERRAAATLGRLTAAELKALRRLVAKLMGDEAPSA
ncbi:MAG: MarR family transcriptional regulator [Rhodospirillaceae bacterium]|nr:MarR family transcriptional regulator [Rhodospirillaceae bacterium]